MRECGEDLLVDMSEVLFNELAFFRLMQDLDDPVIAAKMQQAQYGSEEEVGSIKIYHSCFSVGTACFLVFQVIQLIFFSMYMDI